MRGWRLGRHIGMWGVQWGYDISKPCTVQLWALR